MSEFFISGVCETDGHCERVENDDDAHFFTLYRRANGPSYAVQDFVCRDDAEKFLGLLEALQAALEWIDAVQSDTSLPALPGFDREWVNQVIRKATGE